MGILPHSTGKDPWMMTQRTAALTDTMSGMCTLKSLSHSFYYEQSIFACFHLRRGGLLTGEALQRITPRRWFTHLAAELPYVQTSLNSNLCNIYDLAVRVIVMGSSSHVRDVLYDTKWQINVKVAQQWRGQHIFSLNTRCCSLRRPYLSLAG